jgi:hypothetical protein
VARCGQPLLFGRHTRLSRSGMHEHSESMESLENAAYILLPGSLSSSSHNFVSAALASLHVHILITISILFTTSTQRTDLYAEIMTQADSIEENKEYVNLASSRSCA